MKCHKGGQATNMLYHKTIITNRYSITTDGVRTDLCCLNIVIISISNVRLQRITSLPVPWLRHTCTLRFVANRLTLELWKSNARKTSIEAYSFLAIILCTRCSHNATLCIQGLVSTEDTSDRNVISLARNRLSYSGNKRTLLEQTQSRGEKMMKTFHFVKMLPKRCNQVTVLGAVSNPLAACY